MPVPANNFWSPYSPVAFPGSSGYVTGDQNPSIYGMTWDPVNRRVVSNDPRIPGYTPDGRIKGSFSLPTAPNAAGVNPYANLLTGAMGPNGPGSPPTGVGTNPLALPGVGGRQLLGGYNPTAAPGAGFNPFFTVQNQKDPQIAAQINQILAQYNDLQGLNPTSAVQAAMKTADPAYKQYLAQETGAVGQWFPTTAGGKSDIQTQLESLAARRAAAYQTATNRAMDALSRQQAIQQMNMGGAGTVGSSSYLQKQGLDTAAGLQVAQGLDAATQARNDLMTLLGGQQANLGTRAGLTTGDIQRQLLPSQVGANWFNQMLAGLGPIAQMQLANNFYGLGQAGQSPGVTFPGMGGSGAPGGPVPNSMPIRPQGNPYQPTLNPYGNLRRRPGAPAPGGPPTIPPFNPWNFDEYGNPINSPGYNPAPIDDFGVPINAGPNWGQPESSPPGWYNPDYPVLV